MSLEVLPLINKEQITSIDIYEEYVNIFRNREIEILTKDNNNYKDNINEFEINNIA